LSAPDKTAGAIGQWLNTHTLQIQLPDSTEGSKNV